MDTFMDKLAQKLTAQEMIRANTAAETEELNQLRGQVTEYQECLRQMRLMTDQMSRLVNDKIAPEIYKLVEAGVLRMSDAQMGNVGLDRLVEECRQQVQKLSAEGVAKLENAKIDTAEISRLVEEGCQQLQKVSEESSAKLKSVQVDTEGINQLMEENRAQMKKVSEDNVAKMQQVSADSVEQFKQISQESVAQLQKISEESSQKLQEMKQEKLDPEEIKQVLAEKMQDSNDNVHRECVKVYRNVQAIVVEENGKQTENVNEATKTLKGKLKTVFSISIGALVCSAVGMILQILSALHVF